MSTVVPPSPGTSHDRPAPDNRLIQQLTERWFVRQGIPHFIEDYRSRTHVLPRMVPVLLWLTLAMLDPVSNLLGTIPGLISTSLLAVVIFGTWIWGYALAPRPWRILPSRVNWIGVITVFILLPIVGLTVIYLTGNMPEDTRFRDDPTAAYTAAMVGFIIFLPIVMWLAYLITSYGIVPLTRRMVVHTLRDIGDSATLQARALPVLLLANVFLFFTPELWQVIHALSGAKLAILIGLFVLLSILVIGTGVREELTRIQRTLTAEQVTAGCHGTPLDRLAAHLAPYAQVTTLRRKQEINMLIVFGTRQLIQSTVVGLGILLFFAVLGGIALNTTIVSGWIGDGLAGPFAPDRLYPIAIGPATIGMAGWVITMIKLSATLAAFSAFSFVVTTVSDDSYRDRFFAPAVQELERWLAVRAAYQVLHRHNRRVAADGENRGEPAGPAARPGGTAGPDGPAMTGGASRAPVG
jgi:hypothetical protein